MKHSFIILTVIVAKLLKCCNDSYQKAMSQRRMGFRLLILTMLMVVHVPSVMYAQTRTQSYTINIEGYSGDKDRYYLIASPIDREVSPEDVFNMTSGDYDLYLFSPGEDNLPWRNYKEGNESGFELLPGKGYLYANSEDIILTFTGMPYSGDGTVTLNYNYDEVAFNNWNLVGNPYDQEAYIGRDFYRMNSEGSEIIAAEDDVIQPMEGIFVLAEEDGETLTFSPLYNTNGFMFALNLCSSSSVIDRAVVRFDPGRQLPKFQLKKESTKLYIPIDDIDYAVVRSQSEGELPVHFTAEDDGRYTISLSSKNVDFSYLHIIDKLTGNDIDLLANSSYTFEAKTTDDASRFRVVYSAAMSAPNNQSGESPCLSEVSSNRFNRGQKPLLPFHGEEGDQSASEQSYIIDVEAGTGGEVSGGGYYVEGETCNLTATPDEGYTFLYWTEDENEFSQNETCSFEVYGDTNLKAHFALMLLDGDDNSRIIEDADPENVMLQGRTLYVDKSWNTLCLPFAVSDDDDTDGVSFTDTPLEGAIVKAMDNSSFANGTLTLNFVDAMSIDAGKPYIVKWETIGSPIENPVFKNIHITSTEPTDVTGNAVTFHGIYSPYSTGGEDKTMLYLGAGDTLYYPQTDITIGAFRAFFKLNNDLVCGASSSAGINKFVLNFGDGANSIEEISNLKSQTSNPTLWYMLDGRKLSSMPTSKGIYINNGKKVVIK